MKRNLSFPLAPTGGDPEKKKKKKKGTRKERTVYKTNPDGSVTRQLTKRSGKVKYLKTRKPKKTITKPTPPEPKRTKEQKKKETEIQKRVDKKHALSKEEMRETSQRIKDREKAKKKVKKEARIHERWVVPAEKTKNKGNLGKSKGSYTPTGGGSCSVKRKKGRTKKRPAKCNQYRKG